MLLPRFLRVAVLTLALAAPAGAQQTQLVCQPGVTPNQTVCTSQQAPTGARVAIVAAVVIAGTVVALLVHKHKHHTAPAPIGFPQPQAGGIQKGGAK
jgi:hypothetical protein